MIVRQATDFHRKCAERLQSQLNLGVCAGFAGDKAVLFVYVPLKHDGLIPERYLMFPVVKKPAGIECSTNYLSPENRARRVRELAEIED